MALAIYINAGKDRNGNPKRGWLIADESGAFTDFIDEGYEGKSALTTSPYSNLSSTQCIDVAPAVYRDAYNHAYGGLPSRRSQTFKTSKRHG